MAAIRLLFFLVCCAGLHVASSDDVSVLLSLKAEWQNTPPSWGKSNDPCGTRWEGVTCKKSNSRVTALELSNMGLKGTLSGDIGGLTELISLDLSSNPDLTGLLTPRLGELQNLNSLTVLGCGFTGNIPKELGNLAQLSFLALNSNKFNGGIPPSLGKLSKLTWLDLADNQLSGSIPVSTTTTPGLDLLLNANHFHFNKNQLSGPIPPTLFNSEMKLEHILFDGNQLNGSIPSTLGLVQSLEILRLDRNNLTGPVPSNLNNLTNINELNLAFNELSGPMPNLTGMNSLFYVDLSHNSFAPSAAPAWFSDIQLLTTLVLEYGTLQGPVPQALFSFPQLQQVKLRNNAFNDLPDMGNSISQQLQLVDLQNNQISKAVFSNIGHNETLILIGNPVCDTLSTTVYCQLQDPPKPYSTSLPNCTYNLCSSDQSLSPHNCSCAYPFEGSLYFRGPSFQELSNATRFQSLEMSLWKQLLLNPDSVSLQNPFFNTDDYLEVHLALFPSDGKYFNRTEILRIGFSLSNQIYKPPPELGFGPYYFIGSPSLYPFQDTNGGAPIGLGAIVGIAIGFAVLVLLLVSVAIYAFRQKRRAQRAIELSNPFGNHLRLRVVMIEVAHHNYKEPDGSLTMYSKSALIISRKAMKLDLGDMARFIEECSRVGEWWQSKEHSKDLCRVALRRSGIHLDWKRRLHVALGSARGLTYLHELANPPIIHRDVKTSNILLDETLTAKVADFGLSKLVDGENGHVSTQVKGTMGYLDPEYYMTQQLTDKSDVYSFGIVMLELVTAKQPIEKNKYIVREVRLVMNKKDKKHYGLKEIMDPMIRNTDSLIGFGKFLDLAMRCVEESATDRPTMSDVVKEIETILQSDELNTNSTTASSSATDFGTGKGAPRHPYIDALPRNDMNSSSNAFDYSGDYTLSTKIEPK
ncbi:hypothetical protein HHK36_004455 [Tetracentron sinense]|uniref:non-specific serine/threonine protein kinase n=1 Tax=Tetracentron sinense TaxID=13715 RepID=A0A834ZT01_TETSI|nr:hypothetical protein HHK36_004455 [Tetracentron sinense]